MKAVLKKKKILLTSTLVVLLLTGGGYILYSNRRDDSNTSDQPATSQSSNDSGNTLEEPSVLPSKPGTGAGAPPDADSVQVVISHLSQDQNTVYLRAYVEGASSGTCTARFERPGYSPILRTAPTAASGETYVCQGFNLEKSNFPTKGNWKVIVNFSNPNDVGVSQPKTITIN